MVLRYFDIQTFLLNSDCKYTINIVKTQFYGSMFILLRHRNAAGEVEYFVLFSNTTHGVPVTASFVGCGADRCVEEHVVRHAVVARIRRSRPGTAA